MGKERRYWGGGGGNPTHSGTSGGAQVLPSGCMTTIFQLFDLHKFRFALHQQEVPSFNPDSFYSDDPNILKGIEAPRNSLEMDEPFMEAAGFPSPMKEKGTLDIPVRIKAPKPRADQDIYSEYSSSSPGPKNPNLVARLMGLDLLPHISSPSSSNHSTTSNPPTISSARKSDVDDHHRRLSLQLNKENIGASEELQFLGDKVLKIKTGRRREIRQGDERENVVSRTVGVDITNTIRNRDQGRQDDDHVVWLKPNKASNFLSESGQVLLMPKPQSSIPQEQKCHQRNTSRKCEKIAYEHYVPQLKRQHSTASYVIREKKKEQSLVSSTAKRENMIDKKPIPQSQAYDSDSSTRSIQLPSCSSQPYNQKATHTSSYNGVTATTTTATAAATGGGPDMRYYITAILKDTGIDKTNLGSFNKWSHSLSLPLHPSIFHRLELSFPSATPTKGSSQLSHRSSRRLIFELVDEILGKILKPPCMYFNPWDSPVNGSQLMETICWKIGSFPSADCKVLEDIDGIIDRDLKRTQGRRATAGLEEEGEAIVAEIEGTLVETLVQEMATALF